MADLSCNPGNYLELLEQAQDGDTLYFFPHDYKFCNFAINKKIKLVGAGSGTTFYAIGEAVFTVCVTGVKLENLQIERTIDGATGTITINALEEITYDLHGVTVQGEAIGGVRQGAGTWELPSSINFGDIGPNQQQKQQVALTIADNCTISSSLNEIKFSPKVLCPGSHILYLELNTVGLLPGTRLSGFIHLNAQQQSHSIAIMGDISYPQTVSDFTSFANSRNSPSLKAATWNYSLTHRAAESLIFQLGQLNDEYFDSLTSYQKRDEATDLLFQLTGREARHWYVRRIRPSNQSLEEEIWDLTLASYGEIPLPNVLHQKRKTIRLRCAVEQNGSRPLTIIQSFLINLSEGGTEASNLLVVIKLANQRQSGSGIPIDVLEQILTLGIATPIAKEEKDVWLAYLDMQERIVRQKQFCVSFESHNYGAATRNITFKLDLATATLDGKETLNIQMLWQRLKAARREEIRLAKSPACLEDSTTLGTVEEIDLDRGTVKISLDQDLAERILKGRYSLPRTGYLYFMLRGDLIQIKRQQDGLKDLEQGRCRNPRLPHFIFNSSRARLSQSLVKLEPRELLLRTCNPDQLAAVEKALSADDLVLIQGPPGTGKTTVIAEICYQVARRGGRTLIASQANLAVDNALSRLVHSPIIRALRKGSIKSIEEEGLPFIEERVIKTWMDNTAKDCRQRLTDRDENIVQFKKLLFSADEFSQYYLFEASNYSARQIIEAEVNACSVKIQQQESYHAAEVSEQSRLSKLLSEIMALPPGGVAVDSDTAKNLYNAIISELPSQEEIRRADLEISLAIRRSHDLGLTISNDLPWLAFIYRLDKISSECHPYWQILKKNVDEIQSILDFLVVNETKEKNQLLEIKVNDEYWKDVEKQQKELECQLCECELSLKNSEAALKLLIIDPIYKANINEYLLQKSSLQAIPGTLKKLKVENFFSEEAVKLINSFDQAIVKKANTSIQSFLSTFLYKNTTYRSYPSRLRSSKNKWLNLVNKFQNTFFNIENKKVSIPLSSTNDVDALFRIIEDLLLDIEESSNSISSKVVRLFGFYDDRIDKMRIVKSYLDIGFQELQKFSTKAAKEDLKKFCDDIFSILIQVKNQVNSSISKNIDLKHQLLQKLAFLKLEKANLTQRVDKIRIDLKKLNDENSIKAKLLSAYVESLISEHYSLSLFQVIIRKLLVYIQNYKSSSIEIQEHDEIFNLAAEFQDRCSLFFQNYQYLETIREKYQVSYFLEVARVSLENKLKEKEDALFSIDQKLQQYRIELMELERKLDQFEKQLQSQRQWWCSTWESLPEKFRPIAPGEDIYSLEYLRTVEIQFATWSKELEREEQYLKRYGSLTEDWIKHLQQPSERDSIELKQVFINNANVIGITCSQAASRSFSQHFPNFDVVIIDEVTKSTPPELLLPALKGKKLVLIGDHRQLSPMFQEKSLTQLAEDIGADPDELSSLKVSIFKQLFDQAGDDIKQMLTIQYRMHPDIMGAINQFYEQRLRCGLPDPNLQRMHRLESSILSAEQHLLWFSTPLPTQSLGTTGLTVNIKKENVELWSYQSHRVDFSEVQEGTSFTNPAEIELIEQICLQLQASWISKVEAGAPRKEVGIITFYGAQARLFQQTFSQNSNRFSALRIRVGTVDRFQGMERAVILVSMVRNNSHGDIGFAKEDERINVAFSRAQELLVIVGSQDLFCRTSRSKAVERYKNVAASVRRCGGLIDVTRS